MPWNQETVDRYITGIPEKLFKDYDLSPGSMLLYGIIADLSRTKGYAWAKTSHYENLLKMSGRQLRYYKEELEANELIWIKNLRRKGAWIYPRYLLPKNEKLKTGKN